MRTIKLMTLGFVAALIACATLLILASLAACGGPTVELRPPVPYDPGEARLLAAAPAEHGDWFVIRAAGRAVPLQLATSDSRGRTVAGCKGQAAITIATWSGDDPAGARSADTHELQLSKDAVAHVAGDWVGVRMDSGVCLRTWQLQPGDDPSDQWWVPGRNGDPANMASGGGSPQCPSQGCAWQATIWPD